MYLELSFWEKQEGEFSGWESSFSSRWGYYYILRKLLGRGSKVRTMHPRAPSPTHLPSGSPGRGPASGAPAACDVPPLVWPGLWRLASLKRMLAEVMLWPFCARAAAALTSALSLTEGRWLPRCEPLWGDTPGRGPEVPAVTQGAPAADQGQVSELEANLPESCCEGTTGHPLDCSP